MTDKVLPMLEKFASCPNEGRILSFYEGQFESVYMLLHPFLKPINIPMERFCPSKWPAKKEIIDGCAPVSWGEVLELTGFKSLSDIDVGLRTSILGIKQELSNADAAAKLAALIEKHNIIHPSEGDLPPLLENRILHAINFLGYDWLWLGDEFGTERKLHYIEDLFEKDEIPTHGCVFTHDHALLVTTHWDSHCSLFCSSKDLIERVLAMDNFEGFYCTPKTRSLLGFA